MKSQTALPLDHTSIYGSRPLFLKATDADTETGVESSDGKSKSAKGSAVPEKDSKHKDKEKEKEPAKDSKTAPRLQRPPSVSATGASGAVKRAPSPSSAAADSKAGGAVVYELLNNIDYLRMSGDEFARFVEPSELLPTSVLMDYYRARAVPSYRSSAALFQMPVCLSAFCDVRPFVVLLFDPLIDFLCLGGPLRPAPKRCAFVLGSGFVSLSSHLRREAANPA